MYFTIYPETENRLAWRWNLKSKNHRIMADGGEAYTSERGAYRAVKTIQDAMFMNELPIRVVK